MATACQQPPHNLNISWASADSIQTLSTQLSPKHTQPVVAQDSAQVASAAASSPTAAVSCCCCQLLLLLGAAGAACVKARCYLPQHCQWPCGIICAAARLLVTFEVAVEDVQLGTLGAAADSNAAGIEAYVVEAAAPAAAGPADSRQQIVAPAACSRQQSRCQWNSKGCCSHYGVPAHRNCPPPLPSPHLTHIHTHTYL